MVGLIAAQEAVPKTAPAAWTLAPTAGVEVGGLARVPSGTGAVRPMEDGQAAQGRGVGLEAAGLGVVPVGLRRVVPRLGACTQGKAKATVGVGVQGGLPPRPAPIPVVGPAGRPARLVETRLRQAVPVGVGGRREDEGEVARVTPPATVDETHAAVPDGEHVRVADLASRPAATTVGVPRPLDVVTGPTHKAEAEAVTVARVAVRLHAVVVVAGLQALVGRQGVRQGTYSPLSCLLLSWKVNQFS